MLSQKFQATKTETGFPQISVQVFFLAHSYLRTLCVDSKECLYLGLEEPMLYIHQFPGWTDFRFDFKKVLNALGETRLQEGKLLGTMQMSCLKDIELDLLTKDIVANYAIDGHILDYGDIKKEISLGNNGTNNMVKNFLGAIMNSANPVTEERLFAWHASMGQNKVPLYRNDSSTIHYQSENANHKFEGPNPERIQNEMEHFINWLENSTMDGVIKAAIAHFWFLTIRPFADANGRLARLITILMLARSERTTCCQYSLNKQILEDKEGYFRILCETQASNGDLTPWILWFLETMQKSFHQTELRIEGGNKKRKFFNQHVGEAFNSKEQILLNSLFDGIIPETFTAKDVAALENTSHDTSLRIIQGLIGRGILKATEKGGRSQRYCLA